MKLIKKQQGFTLITVLILSSIASVIVLNSLKDNVNQERLSGNLQKSINSRLASEQGIYESITAINNYVDSNSGKTLNDIAIDLGKQKGSSSGTNKFNHGGTEYEVSLSADGNELVLTSQGNRFEGESVIKARLQITPSGSASAFSDAIVGCEGVSLAGSGSIDSYNSADGNYSEEIASNDGDVSTINHLGADVVLGGGTRVSGDISATGYIDLDNSSINGNLHANGDITMSWGTDAFTVGGEAVRVTGNILTRGNYTQNGNHMAGNVRANGNATMSHSSWILNLANDGLDIQYGGTGTFPDSQTNAFYSQAQYNVSPNVIAVTDDDTTVPDYDSTDPTTNCNHLDIANVTNTVDDGTNNLSNFVSSGSGSNTYLLTPNEFTENGTSIFSAENADFLGETIPVIKFGAFFLKGSDSVHIQGGHVTIFVEGGTVAGNGNNTTDIGFKMEGATQFTIADGSSLTLIAKSEIILGNGADIVAENQGLVDGNPVMSIYSSYVSEDDEDYGISISGDFNVYSAIYAPLTHVEVVGSGVLYGAVRAKTVSVPGDAKIHYDSALGDSTRGGGGSSSSSVSFVGFEF